LPASLLQGGCVKAKRAPPWPVKRYVI